MMIELSFTEIKKKLDEFILSEADLVIGIANGGLVPASLLANKLNCELFIVKLNYRNPDNSPKYDAPVVLSEIKNNLNNKKILLVDDVSVSGKTLEAAKALLNSNFVKTFVMKGKADYVLFPNIKDCVKWPWKVG